MKIVVDINHPAHVHYFKNFIWEMEKKGHEILITASEKEISYKLLDNYGFNYIRLGSYGISLIEKSINIPILDLKMYNAVKNFKPDILLGFGSIRNAHVSKLLSARCIAFDDSEPSPIEHLLYVPFTDAILTPNCFKKNFGKKHILFNGYIELAYLHQKYFKPNPAVLDEVGINKDEKFVLMRFVAWKAGHDFSRKGFDLEAKLRAVKELEKHSYVFISSELELPNELERNKINISPTKIHDILYYSQMFIGDSQTMTTEAALLGTPAIRCNSFVGENDMGNFIELEQKYGLIFNYDNPDKGIKKAIELIQEPNLKKNWEIKREKLLKDKIDVTAFMVKFIEDYPKNYSDKIQ